MSVCQEGGSRLSRGDVSRCGSRPRSTRSLPAVGLVIVSRPFLRTQLGEEFVCSSFGCSCVRLFACLSKHRTSLPWSFLLTSSGYLLHLTPASAPPFLTWRSQLSMTNSVISLSLFHKTHTEWPPYSNTRPATENAFRKAVSGFLLLGDFSLLGMSH